MVFPYVNMIARVNVNVPEKAPHFFGYVHAHVYEHVHVEIRDVSVKTMGYDPSAVIGTHLIPR